MNTTDIRAELFRLQDKEYALFQGKLIPTVRADAIIGVRTPALRDLAKRICREKDTGAFLSDLPHGYFDEDQLHAFIISLEKDFDRCIAEVEAFLPYIGNWATCDQLVPGVFRKEPERLLPYIRRWLCSDRTYTVRFAIKMLMNYFLDENFDLEYADMVAGLRSEEYYISTMRAWYFATALAKQYEAVLPYLREGRLDEKTHNMTIKKSLESHSITAEKKAYLKTLTRKKKG